MKTQLRAEEIGEKESILTVWWILIATLWIITKCKPLWISSPTLTNLLYAYYVSYFLPSIYQERFSAFQEDLLSIQQGKYAVSKLTNGTNIFIVAVFMVETHPALRECISDLEKARQQVIYQARLIMEYHIDCTNEQFQAEVAGLEEDYLVYIMEYVCM